MKHFLLFTFIGVVGAYVNHKVNVIEPVWVSEYGKDYPAKVVVGFKRWLKYHKWVDFTFKRYEYKYYVDE